MTSRGAIPAALERALMIEAGYRCAVHTCRAVAPLEIEHINDYAQVKEHEFSNMLVLCRNCHGLKGTGPRSLDRTALRMNKRNLARINQRYNDTECRVIEYFVENPEAEAVLLPETPVLFGYLIKDGLLDGLSHDDDRTPAGTMIAEIGDLPGVPPPPVRIAYFIRGYALTDEGREFVNKLRDNQEAL